MNEQTNEHFHFKAVNTINKGYYYYYFLVIKYNTINKVAEFLVELEIIVHRESSRSHK